MTTESGLMRPPTPMESSAKSDSGTQPPCQPWSTTKRAVTTGGTAAAIAVVIGVLEVLGVTHMTGRGSGGRGEAAVDMAPHDDVQGYLANIMAETKAMREELKRVSATNAELVINVQALQLQLQAFRELQNERAAAASQERKRNEERLNRIEYQQRRERR